MSANLMTAHREWANRPADERYQSLDALSSAVHERRNRSSATVLRAGELTAKEVQADDGTPTIAFNGLLMPSEPTHWAFGQVCREVNAPAGYLRTLPTDLVVRNLNASIERRAADTDRNGQVKVMTQTNPDGDINYMNAVTSTSYGRIWDADVVSAVQRIVDRTGGKFHNPKAYAHNDTPDGFKTLDTAKEPEPSGLYASDHDVFMFMVDGGSMFDVGPRAQLNRGFIVWNSEVGSRTLGIMTFLFNVVCGNHIIWGAEQVNKLLIRHSSGAPARLDREATPHLLDYVNASAAPVENTIRAAQNTRLVTLLPGDMKNTDDKDFGKHFVTKFPKFNRGEVAEMVAYANREEGKCDSLWDAVQGLTASARAKEWLDARLDLEQRAGKLLEIVATN